MVLLIDPQGKVTSVYSEAIDLACLGPATIRRASYVEPDTTGQWWADLAPVGGQYRPALERSGLNPEPSVSKRSVWFAGPRSRTMSRAVLSLAALAMTLGLREAGHTVSAPFILNNSLKVHPQEDSFFTVDWHYGITPVAA
jgi:hypothetical protein